jgi:hypothetical protein
MTLQDIIERGDIVAFREWLPTATTKELLVAWATVNKRRMENLSEAAFREIRKRGTA